MSSRVIIFKVKYVWTFIIQITVYAMFKCIIINCIVYIKCEAFPQRGVLLLLNNRGKLMDEYK